jgi:hypothetical protein
MKTRKSVLTTAAVPGARSLFSVSSFTATPLSQPQ